MTYLFFTKNLLTPKRYLWYLLKGLACCLCLMLSVGQSNAQITPPDGRFNCDGDDCYDVAGFDQIQDASGTPIPNYAEGVFESASCFTSIDVSVDYVGSDSNGPSLSGQNLGANNQGTSTDNWTFCFGDPLTAPVFSMNGLENGSVVTFKDINGNPIPGTCIDLCGSSLGGPGTTTWTGDAAYRIQLTGTHTCVQVCVAVNNDDAYTVNVGTCLSSNLPPPCATCAPGTSYNYLSLANATGNVTGSTADVFLGGLNYGTATIVHTDLTINTDLAGNAFGAFANGNDATGQETFVLCMDLCEAITVQQLDILGLETESIASVGTGITGLGVNAMPTGLTLSQCGGSNNVIPTGNSVTNTASSCANQSNGNYTVGGVTTSSLCFRYENPAGGCRFDKATFRVGACVADLPDAVPTCPLTVLTVTNDEAAFIAAATAGESTSNLTFQVIQDANGNFFDRTCTQIENNTTRPDGLGLGGIITGNAISTVGVSPCATVVDESECTFCDPPPPCVMCPANTTSRFISLNKTGTTIAGLDMGEVNLNGILVGTYEFLFSDLDISTDGNGTTFGGFDNDGGTMLLQVDFCDALTVNQLDVRNLEVMSQVSVGTTISGTGAAATLGGQTLNFCAGSDRMDVDDITGGNLITTAGPGCGANPNASYTFGTNPVSTLFFKYQNPDGGCSFDYVGFRISVCVPELVDAVPTCPLTVLTVTNDPDAYAAAVIAGGNGNTQSFEIIQDANGNYFDRTCNNIENAVTNLTAIEVAPFSPCSVVVGEAACSFCIPTPPCNECPVDNAYRLINLNQTGTTPGGLDMGNVNLNGVIVGSYQFLFSNLDINTDGNGTTFGGFDNDGGTMLLELDFCDPLMVNQLDVRNLEVMSQVSVGTTISGTGAAATLGGQVLTFCQGSDRMDADDITGGNLITTAGPGCGANPNASYTFGTNPVSKLYFKYQNPDGGCSFDYVGFRIGACVPELPEAIPTCPLVLLEVTEQDGVTTASVYRDLNGLYFNTGVCTDPVDTMTLVQSIAISPCATTMVTGECEFCCEFVVSCPTNTNLGTYNCNTLGNIPTMPTVRTSAGGNITVDNAAGDYQINVGNMPCGTIIANTSDNITAPDVCSTGGQVITRTVTIFDDENGNGMYDMASEDAPISCSFTINITEDTTNPVITCPANVTIECTVDTSPTTNGMATATDNCSSAANIAITFSDNSSQTAAGCGQYDYSIIRTWLATDACGNTASCFQTIEVEDTTPTVITCPANVTIECTVDTSPATNGMATATDNCSSNAEITIGFSDVSTQTTSGCGQYDYSITRTWTATDVCGNSSTCVQIITVEDTTAPVITCPADQALVCNEQAIPLASSAAELIEIGGTVIDNCSDLSELTLTFWNIPPTQSMLDFCSADETDRTIVRTYTITDICGNATTCEQRFVYDQSIVDPIITSSPADQTVDCAVNAFPQTNLVEFETDCTLGAEVVVSEPITSGTANCPGSTIQYTYTVTDVCGRSISTTQTFTISNEGPEFVCPVDICVIECPADSDMIQAQFDDYAGLATVTNTCSGTGYTVGNNFNVNGFIPQNCMNPTIDVNNASAYQVVTFSATDDCGRNATCTALVVIQDNSGPVINGNVSPGLADCNDNNLQVDYTNWATSQLDGLSATDECSPGAGSISYTPLSPNVDCSDGAATTTVSFTAIDACGNISVQTTFYQIIDNSSSQQSMAMVSGNLVTESDELVALANVTVEGTSSDQMMTNSDGFYFFNLEMAQNYSITPSRNDDPLNGITTYDLILLGRHLLEINTLDSPYKMIAADVNESGHISNLDMIELRRLILHIDDEFSSGKSWTFVDADYNFPQPTNPFATTFPTAHNINHLSSNEVVNFTGVKLGDLNATANPDLLQSGDTRSSDGSLKIDLKDQRVKAGQTYQLEFEANDFKDVLGFQFTLDFAVDFLQLVDFQGSELPNISVNNFGFAKADEGKVTVSWNENQSVNLVDGGNLFQLSFTALQDGQLSDLLSINSSLTAQEAYQADLRKDVELNFSKVDLLTNKFALLQNRPNPFTQETSIGFQLPEATKATLSIFDVAGRIVWTQTKDYTKGTHQVIVEKSRLEGNGVYYYQLSTSQATATRKMVLVK